MLLRRPRPARALVLLPAVLTATLAVGLVAGCSSDHSSPREPLGTSTGSAPTAPTDATTAALQGGATFDGETLTYPGEDGKTALELLQRYVPMVTMTGEGKNAFVTGIMGRVADSKTEFWGLYVDGKMAQVGAGSLVTKTGQTITWKIEAIK